MPHSLRVKLKNLQRKGELTDKDIDRIFKALEQESKAITTSTDEPMVMRYPQVDGITPTVVKIEQDPSEIIHGSTYGGVSWSGTYKPQEPKYCDRNICNKNEYNGIGCDECEVTKSQESKTGHWIKSKDQYGNFHYECSKCGNDIATQFDYSGDNYCLECGCHMIETRESEEK